MRMRRRSEGGGVADRLGGNQERAKRAANGASGISRLLGAAKLQSAPGANNPRYATGQFRHGSLLSTGIFDECVSCHSCDV